METVEISAGTNDIDHSAPSARRVRSIGRRAAGGAVWVFLAIAVSKVLGVATYFVLARLLSPDDFGLVRFALVLIGAFTILQDLGVPASIIHSDRSIKEIGGTALTINVAASAVLFGVVVLAAPYMARLAGDDAVGPVLVALAIGLVVLSLGSVQRAMLEKELEFRRKFLPDVIPLAGSGIVSIALAVLGFGAWSLVWGYLIRAVLSSGLLWSMSPIRPRPGFRPEIARELLRYGKHMSIGSIVGFAAINIDYFIVGQSLGTYDLGLYTLAFLIANLPIQIVVEPVQKVMFPAYCHVRDDAQALIGMYENAVTMVSMLTIPACLAIFVAGPVYVPIVFGEQWAGIGVPLQLLAVYTAMRSVASSVNSVLAATGRPDLAWRLSAVRLALLAPLMVLLVWRYELAGIAIAYLLVTVIFIPLNLHRLGRVLEIPASRFVRLFAPQLAGASFAVLSVLAWDAIPRLAPLTSSPLGAVFMSIFSLGVYGVTVVIFNPNILSLARNSELVDVVRRKLKTE